MARNPECIDPTEVRYFSQSFRLPLQHYSDLFVPGRERIKGDKSPSYCYVPAYRIRFIRSIMPSVRLVFMMRNPVERAWSHAVMSLVKHARRRIEEIPQSRFYTFFSRHREWGCYSKVLDRWLRVFRDEQLYISFFDQIVSDPIGLLRNVCAHVRADTGVEWSQFPYRRVVNAGQGLPIPAEYRTVLEEMYREEIARLDRRFGGVVSWWRNAAGTAHRFVVAAILLALEFVPDLDLDAWFDALV